MCLVIATLLMLVGINMFLAGDYVMGLGAIISSLFFILIMARHLTKVKKEQGFVKSHDCFACNTTVSHFDIEDK